MYEPHSAQPLPRVAFIWRLVKHATIVLGLVAVSLLAGMWGYVYFAGMNWIDAFPHASMLPGGIGPAGTLTSNSAKIFAGLYALYAGLVFIASAGILVAPVAHRILHRLHVDDARRR